MTKKEIKKAENHELVSDLAHTYARLCLNCNLGGSLKQLNQHLSDLCDEMLKRELLDEKEVKALFS